MDKKIEIEKLKVESFVTNLETDRDETKEVLGGGVTATGVCCGYTQMTPSGCGGTICGCGGTPPEEDSFGHICTQYCNA